MKKVTLSLALEKYRSTISILKKGYKQEKYRIRQISRSFLGKMPVTEVHSVDIARYRDERLQYIHPRTGQSISTSSIRLELSLLSSVFDICRVEWGFCEQNPVANVRKPKLPPGRDRRLTARENRQILRYAWLHRNPALYSIVVLALETGMRQGEILSLQWENINFSHRVARLPETKNGSRRDIPLSRKARDALLRMGPESAGRVFGYTSQGLKSTWRFMMQKLGIENLHFHDLRHEAISRLFELGTLDIMEVAAISGHKSLSMLKRYTHLNAQKLVRKLEGTRHKGRQAVIDNLIPYPGLLEEEGGLYQVRLLDFDGITASGVCRESAIREAQNLLLRTIVNAMRTRKRQMPSPDQYLEKVDQEKLVMIDPLASDGLTGAI